MDASARWMNDYLDPPASPEEQAELLTRAGFPLEGAETVDLADGSDVRQDFEMTSNRGDCVCHVGLAREIAAISGRTLKSPEARPPTAPPDAWTVVTVTNTEHGLCPLYTARVIRGIKVGPSPAWLADRLRAIGQIPRNNVVDATNFVLFELGQPTHVFDLAKLRGPAIIVRQAKAKEPFLPIGEGEREVALADEDLVIADAERAVAIAGVKGGAVTAVTEATTDVLLEAATFDPVAVRTTSRRLNIASDSSYRFERGVPAGSVNAAADRLAALILDLAGGTLLEGVVADGAAIPPRRTVSMRCSRCWKLLGVPVGLAEMLSGLERLGFQPRAEGDLIHCQVPVHRLDVEREVDLIEEVGRIFGHDEIPIDETIQVRVAPPQPEEMARRAVADELIARGYVETVTHSLISEAAARPFLAGGRSTLRVQDQRAKSEPILRPSILPSLLQVRARNRDRGVTDLNLFETAATYWKEGSTHHEIEQVALLADQVDLQAGLRPMRGTVERLVEVLLGPDVELAVAADESAPWYAPGVLATAGGEVIGRFGLLSEAVVRAFDLELPLLAAELEVPRLYAGYPPATLARSLPAFPPIERDISAIVDEALSWERVRQTITDLDLPHLEHLEFITTFRGKGIPAGRKSLSLRLRFRAPDRTLRHEEVDPPTAMAIGALKEQLGGEIRT